MILKKEQIEKRISSDNNVINQLNKPQSGNTIIIKDGINNHNGNIGAKRLTEEQRVQIGVLASLEGNQIASELFGISTSHVSDIRNANRNVGAGEYGKSLRIIDGELKEKIAERLENTKLTISERAAERLLASLGFLSDDKLENCTAKDIASVASQVSNVFRNMNNSGSSRDSGKPSVRITLNKPREINEESFDIIEVSAS